ncbi:sugar ABC transporter ATP-binding protein [Rhizobium sp. R635]|uniref:ABC transporter ATP-binding protein n=1 Tax=Rhizobium sp. R635 TaxID=1764275 RepID=UPI000B531B34|nr:ABC transporter ATP-binding protein [Rhizobium sp. R635]OWV92178.1 sugar ABC transporter ATP-binding protein [Rhizobium sp. R635]
MSADEWAIRAEGVSKKFGLTLRQSMKYGMRDVGRKLVGRSSTTDVLREGEFWAVNDVGFELHRGEALGIMGVNGCGKTTLLRILNGVYAPDKGRVEVRGRVGALIAAGAGFAPMLTGRENVYVNGALLGLSTKEIDGLMDEIIAFSELGEFIDLPVKNYSSGMFVRLGFAIAAMSRPDILLMDEVLAVGDLNFQKKCYDHILQLKRNGTAIILVSHAPGAIWAVCDRGLFLDRGKVHVDGPIEDVIRAYDDQNSKNARKSDIQFSQAEAHAQQAGELQAAAGPLGQSEKRPGTGDVICTDFRVLSVNGDGQVSELEFRQPFIIEVDVTVIRPVENFILRVVLDAVHYRSIVTLDNYEQGSPIPLLQPGKYTFKIEVPNQNFRPGAYAFNVSVVSKHVGTHLFLWWKCAHLVVLSPRDQFLYSEPNAVMHFDAEFTHSALDGDK